MRPAYRIVTARPQDLPLLPAIELAAATLLAGQAPPAMLNETTDAQEFRDAQAEGRLWVALADDRPVGFAIVDVLCPGLVHLEEIDVHPDHGRRGLGRQLVIAVCEWAARAGHSEITLTTFRDVAWNMPFYARLGFELVPAARVRPEVAAIVDDETQRGLNPARRVVMRYQVPSSRPEGDELPTDAAPFRSVNHVAVVVRDYDEAIAFYRDVLGFDLIEDTPLGDGKRWVLVGPPGGRGASLLLARAATPVQEARVGDQTGGRVFLFLHTDNFWRDYERLRTRGVRFTEAPRHEAYGTVAVFVDLYGNRWDLVQRA